jgi:hypothetical protein
VTEDLPASTGLYVVQKQPTREEKEGTKERRREKGESYMAHLLK